MLKMAMVESKEVRDTGMNWLFGGVPREKDEVNMFESANLFFINVSV